MTNPEIVECASCGWQGKWIDTDSSHCPDCVDECYALSEIYKNDADTLAPEGGDK